jgi:hypothetical protein
MGPLQRICAHIEAVHPYGDRDPPGVAYRASLELPRRQASARNEEKNRGKKGEKNKRSSRLEGIHI